MSNEIKLLQAHIQTLKEWAAAFWHLSEKDISATPQINPDIEHIARIADRYGFDGALFRGTISEDAPLSAKSYDRIEQQISIIPKIIAAIEEQPITIPDDAELLTVPQVAHLLGWGESVVRQRDREGLLPMPIRVGGSIQWHRQELKNWIDASCPPRMKWEQLKSGKGA